MRTREIDAMLKRRDQLTPEEKNMVANAILKNKNTRKVAQSGALSKGDVPLFVNLGGLDNAR